MIRIPFIRPKDLFYKPLRSSLLVGSIAAMALPVMSVAQSSADADSAEDLEEIVVTGSRIRRQDYEANSPITTVTSDLFIENNAVGVETILNQLPQFVPAVTQFTTTNVQNEATNTVGASTISLRGLGSNRSLVLINGRRGQPVNASLAVDTNSIPSSMIERVEIISGGASAVYGADAIGGVTNFILKDNFEGASINTRYGLTQDGLNEEYQISGLFGANTADGRGNVMFGMEYASREEVPITEVDWRVEELNSPNVAGNDFFLNETYIESVSRFDSPSQAAIDQVYSELDPGTIDDRFYGCCGRYIWINPTSDGTGTVFTGAGGLANSATTPGVYKYDGPLERPEYPGVSYRKYLANGRLVENALDQWTSIPLERFAFSSQAKYDFSDSITGRFEARFSKNRNNTVLGYSPSALSDNALIIPYGNEIYVDSLSDTGAITGYDADQNPIFDAGVLAATPTDEAYTAGGIYGLNCPTTGGCTESDVFPMPAEVRLLMDSRDDPNGDLKLNRPMDFIGGRGTQTDTTTFQMVVGLEGELSNGMYWDAFLSHGQTETLVNFENFASLDRWRGVGQSPNFGVNFVGQNNEEGNGNYSGIATCTTGLPLIREFTPSEDCIAAISSNLQNNTKLEQNTLEVTFGGDAFELPAGTMQFSVGAGYRDEYYQFVTDNLTTSESFVETALGLYPAGETVGDYDVTEFFGELLVPLVSGVPGIQELNLELGARYSDYSTTGDVTTVKALFDWVIVDWARIRGGYQTANRAPNIGELFLAPTYRRGSTGAVFGDQCSQQSEGPFSTGVVAGETFNQDGLAGAAFSQALCEAMMGEVATTYYADDPADQALGTGLARDEGNINLTDEEAETYTFGVVIDSPSDDFFWGGLRGSLDWYNIEITDMLALESGDAVFERCLSQALNPTGDPSADACQAIGRSAVDGGVQFIGRSYTNLGRAVTAGIDLQVDWSGQFDFGRIGVNVLANYNLENTTQASPDVDEIDWVGSRGCALGMQCMGYDYRLFSTVSWSEGPWNASLRWSFYPDIDSRAKPVNPATRSRGVHSSYSNFSLNTGYQLNDFTRISLGIQNLFDKLPPRSGGEPWREAEDPNDYNRAATRAGGGTYDPFGRRFYLSASFDF